MSGVKLAVSVMAHHQRKTFIPSLVKNLGGDVSVTWDRINNRWDTGRRALLAHDQCPGATHVMVIQDDAVVSKDLPAGVTKALSHVPDDVVLGLYVGRSRPFKESISHITKAITPATRWVVMDQLHWGVGVVVPVKHVQPMIEWCDQRPDIPNYDKRMSRWFQHKGVKVWYPWPSLVDHRISPSLVRGRTSSDRYAVQFIGADKSAKDYDWIGTTLEVGTKSLLNVGRPANRNWRR